MPLSFDSLVLDGLDLNDGTLALTAVAFPPPKQRQEWIGAADSEHQALVRNPLHENREITASIRVREAADMDTALGLVGDLVTTLQAASQSQAGIELVWTPAGSTFSCTFDVLAGEIEDFPIDFQSGWFSGSPLVNVRLVAKPYWRGEETLTSTTSSSTPFVTMEIVNAVGDIPALGRLLITDAATQSRRHVEWGLEGPSTYDASTSLLVDSDDMVTSGFGGTQTTQSGAYDPNASGNTAIGMTARTATAAIAGVGNLSHVGSFRVKARVYSDVSTVSARLSWRAGDGPMSSNQWAPHRGGSAWQELDLGTIIVPVVVAGTQRWTGQVEVKTSSGTATVRVDYLVLVPTACGYGKARAVFSYRPGVIAAVDDFTGSTATAVLHTATSGRAAPLGGNWVTSGVATDFTYADTAIPSGPAVEVVQRATGTEATRRFAVLGSTNYTDTDVSVDTIHNDLPASGQSMEKGILARWVDSSNYLAVYRLTDRSVTPAATTLVVQQVVAGVPTVLASGPVSSAVHPNRWQTIRVVVFASGTFYALHTSEGVTVAAVSGASTALFTGGALDDGKPGIFDRSGGVITRSYDNFQVLTPPAEPMVVHSGRNMQIRHDDVIRQDSTGTYTGRPASYLGSRFLAPVDTSRVLVKARRNDIDSTVDDNVVDATQIQVGVTPRGLVVPRS